MMMSVLFWIPELKTLYIIHTWPPLDFCVDPALMNFPLVELSPLSKQWAADKRVNLSKMVAPQWCEPNFCTETCHGMGEGAGWPPTISLGSNRLVPVMKGGIVAVKEMKLFRIEKCTSLTQRSYRSLHSWPICLTSLLSCIHRCHKSRLHPHFQHHSSIHKIHQVL